MGLYANLNLHMFNYSVRLGIKQTGRLRSNSIVLSIISEPEHVIIDIEYRLYSLFGIQANVLNLMKMVFFFQVSGS